MRESKWYVAISNLAVSLALVLTGCSTVSVSGDKGGGEPVSHTYPPSFVHGRIEEVFPDTFFVTGASIFKFEEQVIQKSNNMVIVRENNDLTLINTLRLDDVGLAALEALGKVKNVVRIGAFHDRNDRFYVDRYKAKFWALKGMTHQNGLKVDVDMVPGGPLPLRGSSLYVFETTTQPEGIIFLERQGGIAITCDSIKNWTKVDEYFSAETGKQFLAGGMIGTANVDDVWLGAMRPQSSDFQRLKKIKFKHLLSAHGSVLRDHAYTELVNTLKKKFHDL